MIDWSEGVSQIVKQGRIMKNKLSPLFVALLTAGAACTAQAANPFSDVLAGHWAYESVAQLADAGVIEGYDGESFRGDRLMTRYEMAQVVARAMAKGAKIDKLAAEFADELNKLGVRISELEKKSDNVRLNGTFLARYRHKRHADDGVTEKERRGWFTARLEPTFTVNDHWTGHARIEAEEDFLSQPNGQDVQNREVTHFKRIWVQGDYKNFQILAGRLPYLTIIDNGMIFDDELDAAQVTVGKKIKGTVTFGKSDRFDAIIDPETPAGIGGDYLAVEVYNDRNDKFTWGLGFHRWHEKHTDVMYEECGVSTIKIFEAGLGYKFNKNLSLNGVFAWTSSPEAEHEVITAPERCSYDSKHAYSIELDYKKADPAVKNSFGLFAAYRQLGHYAVIAPTYDTMEHGQRGVEFGGSYTFAKNMVGTVKYFVGQKMHDEDGPGEINQTVKTFYTELKVMF